MIVLPNGLSPKKSHEISVEAMAWLAMAEDVLQHLQLAIICKKCQLPIRGNNSPTSATMRVDCGCRALTYRVRADANPSAS